MQLDAVQLREFYNSQLGHVARRLIGLHIKTALKPSQNAVVVGLGYCTPYLSTFKADAPHTIALMPETQGAIVWPPADRGLTSLVTKSHLPLTDNSVDCLIVAHCFEHTHRVPLLLRELWRVLKPEGRLLIVVPNRSGLWAHIDTTPFGYGSPYSRIQLEAVLNDSLFAAEEWSTALHVPPLNKRLLLRSATTWERLGRRFWPRLGGVLVVLARKEAMAMSPSSGQTRRARAFVTAGR